MYGNGYPRNGNKLARNLNSQTKSNLQKKKKRKEKKLNYNLQLSICLQALTCWKLGQKSFGRVWMRALYTPMSSCICI